MSLPLTAAEEETYKNIIDGILVLADLETVTRKKIRSGLEEAVGKSLAEQKEAIKLLIAARFDAIASAPGAMPTPPTLPLLPSEMVRPSPKRDRETMTNGHSGHGQGDEDDEHAEGENEDNDGEIEVSMAPAKKKQKRESSLDDDAKLAAALQAQENQLARARTTRGGGSAKPSKPKPKKKAAPKKSGKKVKAEDESDAEGSGSEAPEKRKAGGGFQKPFNLSYNLALLCGESVLPRPQVVKKLWEHIKANDLQDPKDKRQIICDDMMFAVFKMAKVDMFQMNKMIGNHLYPVGEE